MEEVWKTINIEGFEDTYQISNKGRVHNMNTGRFPNGSYTHDGYNKFVLQKGGKQKRFMVHRLVALHFIPNPENKETVNHKDGNKLNNNVENLEWATRSENELHSFRVLGKVAYQPMKGRFGKEHNRSRSVVQVSLDGFFLAEYGSILEASRVTGVNPSNITMCHKGIRPTAGGYKWL